jgi:ATP citrate (pro-S)-lyase
LKNANGPEKTLHRWIAERMLEKEIQVGEHTCTQHDTGVLDHFIVEPFLPHEQTDECYFCIQSEREGEEILVCSQGGR